MNSTNPYRNLPSVENLLAQPEMEAAAGLYGRTALRDAAREVLEAQRAAIAAGEPASATAALVSSTLQRVEQAFSPSLFPVINATGVIVHTNLGRAPLSPAARQAMVEVGQGYSNLEFSIVSGRRGSRYDHAEHLLCTLSGAEAALVVNNNAAAITLLLRTIASDKEVIVSRGELVEIGGGFRIPDILRQSGARLAEVGTTNRTRLLDYQHAISTDTAAFLKVHQSNFKILGFTESTSLADLVALGNKQSASIPVLNDQGSGTLLDTEPYGLAYEPTVQDSVAADVSATTFSGDKLLGGPQAGIIVGQAALIAKLKSQPLTRALRVDKTTLAALQATLMAYLRGTAAQEIPVWQMISAPLHALHQRAQAWADTLARMGVPIELQPGESAIGGGALPGQTLPTTLLAISTRQEDRLASLLRQGNPPVIARINEDNLLFDPRTVDPDLEVAMLAAIESAWQQLTQ